MDKVDDGSVAVVVTSPPVLHGKQYEEELEREGVASYLEYLELLTDVFAECVRKLDPVAGSPSTWPTSAASRIGACRRTSSGSSSTTCGLLLRGELIWQKAEGASGRCAWVVPQRVEPGAP